jgi:hypothetical protein
MRKAHALAGEFSKDIKDFCYTACRMMGEVNLIALQWELLLGKKVPAWNICDKLISDTFDRRKQWKAIRTLYFPVESELSLEIIRNFWDSAERNISGSSERDIHADFAYCDKKNTHAKPHRIPHPFDEGMTRHQDAHICHWGPHIAITSVVGNVLEVATESNTPEQIVSTINQNLPLGSATILGDQVMLAFPMIAGVVWPDQFKEDIAGLLAHWADRHQWTLLNGKDDDELAHVPMQIAGVKDMNTSEAIAILRSAKQWCEELNASFNNALGVSSEWKTSSFDRIVENGTITSTSQIFKHVGEGKFQIGYVLAGLSDKSQIKTMKIFLSAKRANVRVVSDDMKDVAESMKADYIKWLNRNGFTIVHDAPCFNYAYSDHHDENQYRRICIDLPADALEIHNRRAQWIELAVDLASKRMLNEQFQFNVTKDKVERLI